MKKNTVKSKRQRAARKVEPLVSVPWTLFMDMNSGGDQKLDWPYIYIQAPEAEAKVIFFNRFGRNPERVTCTCCGEDYSTSESPTFEEASAYYRGCAYENGKYVEKHSGQSWDKYQTVAEYIRREDVLVIHAADIKASERKGDVPQEGYVWA